MTAVAPGEIALAAQVRFKRGEGNGRSHGDLTIGLTQL